MVSLYTYPALDIYIHRITAKVRTYYELHTVSLSTYSVNSYHVGVYIMRITIIYPLCILYTINLQYLINSTIVTAQEATGL